ncbi:TolC family protein [bacterium]|nr:TolC family protein [bacterium]
MSARSMSAWLAGLLLAAAGAAAAPPEAGAPSPQAILSASPDSALAATIAALPGERLALDAAVDAASRQAADARIAEAQLAAATEAVRREKGSFDPELFGGADWSGADTPSASLFAGADVLETETSLYEAGARIRLPLGTELAATVNSTRITSNSAFAALDPEYQSSAGISLRQPLLKGFGPSARADLSYAERSRDAAGARYDGSLLAVRAEVESVYWELYAAERNHAVTRIIRERATAFLSDAQLRARAGMIGPSQVANAEFFLTEAEQALLDTEENLDRLSDRLATLTGRRPAGERFRAADEPPREFALVDQDTLVAVTMRRNPELQALARDADALRALESGATWDARPTLDLLGGLGGAGLAGAARDVYFPGDPNPVRTSIDGDRGEALGQAAGRDYPNWNVGFVFALPLGNREGKGERDRVRAEVVRAEQVLLSARRDTEELVRAQHRELERGRRRLEIATRGVSASIRQVDIGMVEYRNGRTTAFEVVRLAADLATAQQRYSDALVRTARAAAILRRLTGGWYDGGASGADTEARDEGNAQ